MNKNKITKKTWIIIGIVFIILSIILALVAYYFTTEFYPNVFSRPRWMLAIQRGRPDWMQKIIQQIKVSEKAPDILKRTIENKKNNSCTNCVRRSIDGIYIEQGRENLYPAAVVIENHVDARPSSGLANANLVFEAEAEGGITRFLAVFANGSNIDEIGPVRSARPYFIDWAREFSAVLVHCGGSPAALVKIVHDNIFSLNEFYQGDYFWRSKKNNAPHNIYISSENLEKYLESKGLEQGKFLSWKYKDDKPTEAGIDGANITINFKPPNYVVDWIYNMENNDFIRYQSGQRHKDIDGEEIRAKNIIIMTIDAEVIDDELRLKMDHIGEGKAVVCLDGQCTEGKWNKKTSSSRTRFYDENGEEFVFNAGTSWVEVVRPDIEVEY